MLKLASERKRTAYREDPNFPGEHPATRRARLQTERVRKIETEIHTAQQKLESAKKDLAVALLSMQRAGQESGWANWWRMALK